MHIMHIMDNTTLCIVQYNILCILIPTRLVVVCILLLSTLCIAIYIYIYILICNLYNVRTTRTHLYLRSRSAVRIPTDFNETVISMIVYMVV